MISAMAAFGIAIGSASLICYALMTRWRNSKRTRRPTRGGSAPDASSYATGEGWTHGHGSGSGHSMSDGSGNPTDFGTGDSGGGGGDGGGSGGD